ncbi:MAG: polC [Candidatus Kaiserbacteria bacterium]|nr:polC [Candidatus Kaiserbacteria bacterium]
MSLPREYAIIDTETTGMRPPFSRVIDIGIIRVKDGKIVDTFQSLINPGTGIPSQITRITDITDRDLIDAPGFDEVALRVEDILKGAVFVAHNAAFDYAFIKAEFSRIGISFKAPTLCTVRLSRSLYPRARGHSLDAIIARHNLQITERHRAYPDARAVHDFLTIAKKTIAPKKLAHAVDSVMGSSLGRVPKETFKELSDTSGVYFFHGPDQELLYIGKSKNIRTRVRSHFSAQSPRSHHLQSETAAISTMETSGELSALILESALIKRENPLYNRALTKKKSLVVAQRIPGADGYDTIALTHTSTMHADPNIMSVFRSLSQGKSTLRTIAHQHALCEKRLGLEKNVTECFAHQLGTCDGACIGAVSAEEFNTRLEKAFETRKLRIWPYKGVILITEQKDENSGTIFFIDNWSLKGAYRYEDGNYSPFIESGGGFDYDTYKILVRFMRNPVNKRAIKVISTTEYQAMMAECTNSYEAVVSL